MAKGKWTRVAFDAKGEGGIFERVEGWRYGTWPLSFVYHQGTMGDDGWTVSEPRTGCAFATGLPSRDVARQMVIDMGEGRHRLHRAVRPHAPVSTLPAGDPGWDANGAPAADVSRCNGNVARVCEWDGCAPLTGRQKRFASDRCRIAHYEHHHPRLGLPPVIPEGRSLDRLVALCADGRYRTIPEMAHETGTREATVARRIQESQSGRKGRALARFQWDVRVRAHSKAKEYMLVLRAGPLPEPCPACMAVDGDLCNCEGCMHCGRIYREPAFSGGPVCPEGRGCSRGDGRG